MARCVDLWADLTIAHGYNREATVALFQAMAQNGTPMVEQAIQNGADVNAFDTQGITPLLQAAVYPEKIDILRVLLLNGCNINYKTRQGETALNKAVFFNNRAAAKLLIEFGANVSIMNLSAQKIDFLDNIITEINNENKLAFLTLDSFFYEKKRNIVFAQTMGQLLALPKIPLVSACRRALAKSLDL